MNQLIYDSYGLLQDVMRALKDNANLIPLHVRTEIARHFVEALGEDPGAISMAAIPKLLSHDVYRQKASQRAIAKDIDPPALSVLGKTLAY